MKASAYFSVDSIGGSHATKELKKSLGTLPGVMSVSVSNASGTVAVDYDTSGICCEKISSRIKKLGYDIEATRLDRHIM